ncbi:hypothetical protein [Pseudomonas sp. TWP3-1]|uniref:hypothetical protein n=1 Tax=Pseudomonas sp. TWP3-1 TaxID=2804631 RepID=UPI003CEB018E
MRKFLGILSAVVFAVSIFSALLWMGGIAGAVTGGGRNTVDVDFLLGAAQVLFVLSLMLAVVAFCWPKVAQLNNE